MKKRIGDFLNFFKKSFKMRIRLKFRPNHAGRGFWRRKNDIFKVEDKWFRQETSGTYVFFEFGNEVFCCISKKIHGYVKVFRGRPVDGWMRKTTLCECLSDMRRKRDGEKKTTGRGINEVIGY